MATYNVLSTAPVPVGSSITTIRLKSTSAQVQTNVPFTFGQPFARGQFPKSNAAVELRTNNGEIIPCQLDVKATFKDGSIKHAIISGIIPSLPADKDTFYNIVRSNYVISGLAPVPSDFSEFNTVLTLTNHGTDLAGPLEGTTYTADAAKIMASGKYDIHLSGPIVSEWLMRAPLVDAQGNIHPELHARYNIRMYKGINKAKIDCIVENGWVKPSKNPVNNAFDLGSVNTHIYDYNIKVGSVTVDKRAEKGYLRARLTGAPNTYNGTSTGVPNNSTVYTAVITIDGVAKPISVTGSAIQNYGQLYAVITSQLGGLGVCIQDETNLGLRIVSNTTGRNSSVSVDYGTLFPALGHPQAYRPIRGDEHIHYVAQRWKKTFWWNGEPMLFIGHDKNYLVDSLAVPPYMRSLTGSPDVNAYNKNMIATNGGIGRNGIMKKNMFDFGYANSIGIFPEWVGAFVISQDPDSKSAMLGMADLQGSWQVHSREIDTDQCLSFTKWPMVTTSPNIGDSKNYTTGLTEKIPFLSTSQPWIPNCENLADISHHPDSGYVPYLVTGDHFYMENMLSYFITTCVWQNPHYTWRNGNQVLFRTEQVRAQAWMFRSLNHNRYLLPDNHPHRPELEYIAASNVEWYNTNYVAESGPGHSKFGVWGTPETGMVSGQVKSAFSLFMEVFAIQSMGRAVELGFEEFLPLFGYKSKIIKGLLTSGPDYCWQMATTYRIQIKPSSNEPEFDNWNQVYLATVDPKISSKVCGSVEMGIAIGEGQNNMVGYPLDVGGYPANMQPAVAYCDTFDMPGGKDAWLVFDSRVKKANYNLGPQFGIEPRTFIASTVTPVPADPTVPPTIGKKSMSLADRVKDSTTTTGTGALTLLGTSETNFRPFLTPPVKIGDIVPVSIIHRTLPEWENGEYTLTSALQLTPLRVTSSSNNNQKVSFSAGVKDVALTLTADYLSKLAGVNNTVANTFGDTTTTKLMLDVNGVPTSISLNDASDTFADLPTLPLPAVGTDQVWTYRGGVDYRTTLNAIAAAVAAINGVTPQDTLAPTLSSAKVSGINAASATGTVITDEANGTMYCLALTTNTTTAAAVKASSFTQAVTSTGTKTFNVTSLTASTQYYLHFVHVDAIGNTSAIMTSDSFTTLATADTTAPTLSSPTATQTGPTTASGTVSTTESNGTLYRMISVNATETAAAVKAANLTSTVSAVGTQSVTFTGLTANTQYYAHYVHHDAAGNDSVVANSAAFTTAAAAEVLYDISAYNASSTPLATLDGSKVVPSHIYGGKNGYAAGPTNSSYWNIKLRGTNTNASGAVMGWSFSATTPPQVWDGTGTNPNLNNVNPDNYAVPIGFNGTAFFNASDLWIAPGFTGKAYLWVRGQDGAWYNPNPSGMTITGV
jgi:hypothetical protein